MSLVAFHIKKDQIYNRKRCLKKIGKFILIESYMTFYIFKQSWLIAFFFFLIIIKFFLVITYFLAVVCARGLSARRLEFLSETVFNQGQLTASSERSGTSIESPGRVSITSSSYYLITVP